MIVVKKKKVEVFGIIRSLDPSELPYPGSEAANLICAAQGRSVTALVSELRLVQGKFKTTHTTRQKD